MVQHRISIMPSIDRPSKVEHHDLSVQELVDVIIDADAPAKNKLPLLKLGHFTRRDQNGLAYVTGVEGDYDGGDPRCTLELAAERLRVAGIEAIIHTSATHTAENPRWRVLSFIGQQVPKESRAGYVDRLQQALGDIPLAEESWSMAQAYYFGRVNSGDQKVLVVEGRPLMYAPEAPRTHALHDADTVDRVFSNAAPRIPDSELISRVLAGTEIHENLRTLVARMQSKGVESEVIRQCGLGIAQAVAKTRGRERAIELIDELERLIIGGEQKGYFRPSMAGPFTLEALDMDALNAASLSPREIVPFVYYQDVGQLIGPGGVGKSTFIAMELAQAALGKTVRGEDTMMPPVRSVIITAEDSIEIWAGRFREVMNTLGFTDEQKAEVLDRVRFFYNGIDGRLCEIVKDTVVSSPWVRDVVESLNAFAPDIVIFDPAVSFGVGESRVNDSEHALIRAARTIVGELRCAVHFIHHTGKNNARERTSDQYSGRGGSALADGSRTVRVMSAWFHTVPDDRADFFKITGYELQEGEQGIRLATSKLTYSMRPNDIFMVRRGWAYEFIAINPPDEDEIQRIKKQSIIARIQLDVLKFVNENEDIKISEINGAVTGGATTKQKVIKGAEAAGLIVKSKSGGYSITPEGLSLLESAGEEDGE